MNISLTQDWDVATAQENFLRCCGSERWAQHMATAMPFANEQQLQQSVEEGFAKLTDEDWLQAFRAHPKIGDLDAMKQRFASTANWSAGEQGSMAQAAESLLLELAEANKEYEEKNGFIFIVCATGKSPREMLTLLRDRLGNDRATELHNAAQEQKKITQIRLEKLLP